MSTSQIKYIYGLHAGDGVVRYIGRTSSTPHKRLWGHKSDARVGKTRPIHNWIREHGEECIEAVTLEEFVETANNTAADREKAHILQQLSSGGLLNVHAYTGGSGTINRKEPKEEGPHYMVGTKMSEETKEKISEKQKWHAEQRRLKA